MIKTMKIIIIILAMYFSLNAQTDVKYNYENGIRTGDRSSRIADAPSENRNDWLTLIATQDDPSCVGGCLITHELNIHQLMNTYTHYVVKTVDDNGTNTTSIATIPNGGVNAQLNGIDRCLGNGSRLDVFIYLYRYIDDPSPTEITKSIFCNGNGSTSCECPSPSIRNAWLTPIITVGGAKCPTSCKIDYEFDIVPSSHDCFTWYYIEEEVDGISTISATNQYYKGMTFDFSDCLAKGKTRTITIHLLKNSSGTGGTCSITQDFSCDYDCCDYINVHFDAVDTPGSTDCCWIPKLTSNDAILCGLENVEIKSYLSSAPTVEISDANGKICLDGSQVTEYEVEYEVWVDGILCSGNRGTTTLECDKNDYYCCDNLEVNFNAVDDQGDNCCWYPFITSIDKALCDEDEATVTCYNISDPQNPVLIPMDSEGLICLDRASAPHEIEYEITVGDEICKRRQTTLECGSCDCPEDELPKWLDLQVDKEGTGCTDEQCAINVTLDVPEKYKYCFTNYTLSYFIIDKAGNVQPENEHSVSNTPIPEDGDISGQISNLPPCINPGEKIFIEVRLYYGDNMDDYCQINIGEGYCEKIPRVEPCEQSEEWVGNGCVPVTMPNGCEFEVCFTFRKTSDGHQDVQMTYIDPLGCDGSSYTDEQLFKKALPEAIKHIIENYGKYDPQKTKTANCYDFWRVFQKSCWTEYTLADGSKVLVPCETECCGRKFRVCNYNGTITISDLNVYLGTSSADCATLSVPPYPLDEDILSNTPCRDVDCGMYLNFIETADTRPSHEEVYVDLACPSCLKITINDNNIETSDLNFNYSLLNTSDYLDVTITNTSLEKITIKVYSLIAQVKILKEFTINSQNQKIRINIAGLKSGTYLIEFSDSGKIYGTNKFQISR